MDKTIKEEIKMAMKKLEKLCGYLYRRNRKTDI